MNIIFARLGHVLVREMPRQILLRDVGQKYVAKLPGDWGRSSYGEEYTSTDLIDCATRNGALLIARTAVLDRRWVIFMIFFSRIVQSSLSKNLDRPLRRLLLLAFCLGPPASGLDARAEPQISPTVSTKTFDCIIEPQQIVKLASPVLGVIARLDVDRGDLVRQGQIVGKLEDGVEAAALELARARATNEFTANAIRARLEFLRKKHFRMDHLHSKAVSSLATVEEAEAEAKVFEQQLKEAELNRELARLQMLHAEEVLMQRTLRSPVNGVVVERLLVPGEYRNEQTPVLTLAQIDTLRVEVFVPTAYYGQITPGSKAQVRPEDPIGGTYSATVSIVDRVLDAASGTFGVRLLLPNSALELPAGIRCKISFEGTDAAPAVAEKSLGEIEAR